MLESNEDASVADDEDEEGDDGGEDELGPHLVVMGVKYRQRPRRRRSHLLSCLLLFCVPVRLHVDKSRLFFVCTSKACYDRVIDSHLHNVHGSHLEGLGEVQNER